MTLFPGALMSDTVHHVPAALISEIKLQVSHTDLFFPGLDSDNFFLFINVPLIPISIAEAKTLHGDAVEILSKTCLAYR